MIANKAINTHEKVRNLQNRLYLTAKADRKRNAVFWTGWDYRTVFNVYLLEDIFRFSEGYHGLKYIFLVVFLVYYQQIGEHISYFFT